MHRFFHECFSDPILGAVIAVALILVLVMAWFVLKDGFSRNARNANWRGADGATPRIRPPKQKALPKHRPNR